MPLNPSFPLGLQTFQANALRLGADRDPIKIALGDALSEAFRDSGLDAAARNLTGPIKLR